MSTHNFTTTFLVSRTPQEVFNTLTDARNWWSGLYGEAFEGSSKKLNDEFSFRAGDGAHYSRQKLVEWVPYEKISWHVTESKLGFPNHPDEWTGTRFSFRLSERNGQTEVTFTHTGLSPILECYTSCAPAWTKYLERLAERWNEGTA